MSLNKKKEIVITLGRIEGNNGEENYCYLEDTTTKTHLVPTNPNLKNTNQKNQKNSNTNKNNQNTSKAIIQSILTPVISQESISFQEKENEKEKEKEKESKKIKIKIPLNFEESNSQIKENSILSSSKTDDEINIENFYEKENKEIQSYNFEPKINYLIPNSSSWFNYDDIHPFEIKANQEFFNGKFPSKTAEIYKQYRNFVINLYKENPEIYLSSTSKKKRNIKYKINKKYIKIKFFIILF
jgi:hypothetical protein